VKLYDEGVCGPSQMFESENGDWVRHDDHVAAMTEATALLARIVKYAREDRAATPGVTRLARVLTEAEELLSRAPAQPTAPTPDECHPAYGEHLKPAAPTPEFLRTTDPPVEPWPAAPESSAGQAVGFEQLWEGWRGRASAAEAQLAAVNRIITDAEGAIMGESLASINRRQARAYRLIMNELRPIPRLTPAASPGAGGGK
jgi:hypothetical protein